MVMAGTERPPATTTDDSLACRLQWLRQRREALQEKLAAKNNELKNLCIDEAELTGVLPPEIPLEPGESPPAFRRRVATCFAHPQNHVNRLKTTEADVGILGRLKTNEADLGILGRLKTNEAEESSLELERQVQVNIAEAALGIFNDPAESKAVRRKHRSIYQQSQRRLRELDARLNFIRQAYGRVHLRPHPSTLEPSSHSTGDLTQSQTNVKHRTKKPRPPLDNLECEIGTKTISSRSILQETGINLSPSGVESHLHNHGHRQGSWNSRDYRTIHDEPGTSTIATDPRNYNHPLVTASTVDGIADRRRNPKYPDHDYNDNHDVYILPDRYRPRTYSQGTQGSNNVANICGQKLCQDSEKNYRIIPNTYTEEERQMRYRQMQQKRHHDNYASQQAQQIISQQHQKPPQHHNYRNYNVDNHNHQSSHQNNQTSDNRTSQLSYSHSDDVAIRSNQRYKNFSDDTREINKNHVAQTLSNQRSRNYREPTTVGRLSKTNVQDCPNVDSVTTLSGQNYWIRENDDNSRVDDTTTDRFGSLDRRKYNAQCEAYNATMQRQHNQHTINDERVGQSRYNVQSHSGSSLATSSSSSNRDYVTNITGSTKFTSSQSGLTSQQQNYNSQVLQSTTTTTTTTTTSTTTVSPHEVASQVPRALVRTQSLGSVETWQQQQQQHQQNSMVGRSDVRESQPSPLIRRDDVQGRRGKEKEWYETWMDSGQAMMQLSPGSENLDHRGLREIEISRTIVKPTIIGESPRLGMIGRTVGQLQSIVPPPPPPPPPSPPSFTCDSTDGRTIANVDNTLNQRMLFRRDYDRNRSQTSQRLLSSPKSREIPAESKPSVELRQHGDETMTTGSERSPDICTIVQAGKYQPYREVTKPFEMSDFYKYSTKYRKRAEAVTQMRNLQAATGIGDDDDGIVATRGRRDSSGSGVNRDDEGGNLINPVQRKIYEPVQRMTCQPYEGHLGRVAGDEGGGDWRASTTSRTSSEDSTVV